MKIAIFGASGWIGGAVTREALKLFRASTGSVEWSFVSPPCLNLDNAVGDIGPVATNFLSTTRA